MADDRRARLATNSTEFRIAPELQSRPLSAPELVRPPGQPAQIADVINQMVNQTGLDPGEAMALLLGSE